MRHINAEFGFKIGFWVCAISKFIYDIPVHKGRRCGIQSQFPRIPGNLWSLKFPARIPGNFEDFPKLSFLPDSDSSILRKTSSFSNYVSVNSTEQWAVVPHFEFMELSNDLLGLHVTNSNLFSITVNMTHGNTTLQIALFPYGTITNYYTTDKSRPVHRVRELC